MTNNCQEILCGYPGKFWNHYDILYKNHGAVNSGWANKDNLKKFASKILGLDTQKFNSCLDNGKYVSLVKNDLAFATSLGLQGPQVQPRPLLSQTAPIHMPYSYAEVGRA